MHRTTVLYAAGNVWILEMAVRPRDWPWVHISQDTNLHLHSGSIDFADSDTVPSHDHSVVRSVSSVRGKSIKVVCISLVGQLPDEVRPARGSTRADRLLL